MDIETSAQKWRDLLKNEGLSPEDRIALEHGTIDDIIRIANRLGIEDDPFVLVKAREDASVLEESAKIGKQTPTTEKTKPKEEVGHVGRTHAAHGPTYEHFKEQAEKDARKAADRWSKKPDLTKAKTRDEAFQLSLDKAHEDVVRRFGKEAKEWASKNPKDKTLAQALIREETKRTKRKTTTTIPIQSILETQLPKPLVTDPAMSPSSTPRTIDWGEINPTGYESGVQKTPRTSSETQPNLSPPAARPQRTGFITKVNAVVYGAQLTRKGALSRRSLRKSLKKKAEKKVALAVLGAIGIPVLPLAIAVVIALIAIVFISGITLAITNPDFASGIGLGGVFNSTPTPTPGGPTPTPTSGFTYYCQYGKVNSAGVVTDRGSWNFTRSNGRYCNIYSHGCAIVSLAMVMTYFNDPMDPIETMRFSNYVSCEDATFTSEIDDEIIPKLRNRNYSVTDNLVNWESISGGYRGRVDLTNLKSYIDRGFLLWAGARITYATRTGLTDEPHGHSFVIVGVDPENDRVTAYDPTFCQESPTYLSGGLRVIRNATKLVGPIGCDNDNGTGPTDKRCGWYQMYAVRKR